MPFTLQQISEKLGLQYTGNPATPINGVASLGSAGHTDLCFLNNSRDFRRIDESRCAAVIVPLDFTHPIDDTGCILSPSPQLSFIKAIELICPADDKVTGIHASAQISASASIGDNVSIGALVVIDDDVVIGPGCRIDAACVIEAKARLGADCHLHSRVSLARQVEVGDRCVLHSGAVIGSDGFGLVEEDHQWIKVPQIGKVLIGNDVEIGANTTVDRGALDDTVIENGCKLDNQIQVAHNVRIGEHTAIAACVGIAGSAVIGRHCKIGGAAVVLGHLRIADHVVITAMSLVTKDIKKSGVYSSGTPLMENSEWHKANVRYKSLDGLARIVKNLRKQSSQ